MRIISFLLILLFVLDNIYAQDVREVQDAREFQEELNSSFRNSETSPLRPEDREKFVALDFYPVDPSLIMEADFLRTPLEMPFEMPTTTERKPLYVKYGEAYFQLKGKKYKLNIYQNLELLSNPEYADYLFVSFTDLTNGKGSYSGGRYIDTRTPVGKKIILNFNKAYNPYCAYNGKYSCPIPPEENHMEVKIRAGVKEFDY